MEKYLVYKGKRSEERGASSAKGRRNSGEKKNAHKTVVVLAKSGKALVE